MQRSLAVDREVDKLFVDAAVVSWQCLAVEYQKILQLEELPLSL